MSPNPKYQNKKLTGVFLTVTNRNTFRPYLSGILLLQYLYHQNPKSFKWREKHFDRLCGTEKVRQFITEGKNITEFKQWMDTDLKPFLEIRKKYLLY
jgi:uncharacterized protein YbbC (DUF1343 family)